MITSNGSLTAGQSDFLDCFVTETIDPATYQWFNSNGTQLTNTSQLLFSPLLASHAGNYTCRATVGSLVVENSDNIVEVNCKILRSVPSDHSLPWPLYTAEAGTCCILWWPRRTLSMVYTSTPMREPLSQRLFSDA